MRAPSHASTTIFFSSSLDGRVGDRVWQKKNDGTPENVTRRVEALPSVTHLRRQGNKHPPTAHTLCSWSWRIRTPTDTFTSGKIPSTSDGPKCTIIIPSYRILLSVPAALDYSSTFQHFSASQHSSYRIPTIPRDLEQSLNSCSLLLSLTLSSLSSRLPLLVACVSPNSCPATSTYNSYRHTSVQTS